jgi:hypothetical protein
MRTLILISVVLIGCGGAEFSSVSEPLTIPQMDAAVDAIVGEETGPDTLPEVDSPDAASDTPQSPDGCEPLTQAQTCERAYDHDRCGILYEPNCGMGRDCGSCRHGECDFQSHFCLCSRIVTDADFYKCDADEDPYNGGAECVADAHCRINPSFANIYCCTK